MTIMSSGTALFHPWELRWSKKKSRFYYYNLETKTSQWKRPPDPPETEPKKPLPDVKRSHKKSSPVIKHIGKMPGKGIKEKSKDATSSSSSGSHEQKAVRFKTPQKPKPDATAEATAASTAVPIKVPLIKTISKLQSVLVQKVPTFFDASSHEAAVEEEQMEVEESPEVKLIVEEIQGVRDEMQLPQTEELSREIQMIVDCLSSISGLPLSSAFSQMFLILDTNLFLEEWGNYLLQLKAWIQKQTPSDFMVFVIPWIVMQELDRIKDNRYQRNRSYNASQRLDKPHDLKGKARRAVNVIHEWLVNRDPGVMGENPREAAEAQEIKNGYRIENNDDKILHCCLHYQERYSVSQVALLTLDKNLRNKAMILGINAFTRETLNNWLLNTFPSFVPIQVVYDNPTSSSASNHASQQSASSSALHSGSSTSTDNPTLSAPKLFGRMAAFVSSYGQSSPAHSSTSMHLENPSAMEGDSSEAASEDGTGDRGPVDLKASAREALEAVMLDGLSTVLQLSMEDAYKSLWERTLDMKRPWTIATVVKAIDKFWISIFKSFWHRNELALMKDVAVSIGVCPESPSKLLELIETCRRIWTAFYSPRWSHDTKYAVRFKELRKEVLLNLQNLENFAKSLQAPPVSVLASVESTPSDDELQNIRDCFNAVLNQIISMSELLKMQLASTTDTLSRRSLVATYISIHRFMADLHGQYQKAMLQSNDSEVYTALASSLNSHMSFQIQTNITVSPITWQAMKGFFCDVSQSEVVQIGLSQIMSIVASVDEGCQLISQSEADYAAEHLTF